MKFLIGIISGIALAAAGVTVVSTNPFDPAAPTVTPEVAFAQTSVAQTQTAAKPVQRLTGELSHKDTGAFELKVTVRQNGVLVDRDVRVLVARARVTNRAGLRTRLPLDDATARVTGSSDLLGQARGGGGQDGAGLLVTERAQGQSAGRDLGAGERGQAQAFEPAAPGVLGALAALRLGRGVGREAVAAAARLDHVRAGRRGCARAPSTARRRPRSPRWSPGA